MIQNHLTSDVSLRAAFGPLLSPRQIAADAPELAAYDADQRAALWRMTSYVSEFLTAPHPDLGRKGAVCPFVADASRQDLVRLTASSATSEPAIVRGMIELREELAALGDGAPHQAIVAVFPTLQEPEGARLIERIQKALKLSFVERGLMIGQFFPSCSEPGLWNRAFRPLQAPVISLAVRDMTIFDAPFMLDRAEYVAAFIQAFGPEGRARVAKAARDRELLEPGGWLAAAVDETAGAHS